MTLAAQRARLSGSRVVYLPASAGHQPLFDGAFPAENSTACRSAVTGAVSGLLTRLVAGFGRLASGRDDSSFFSSQPPALEHNTPCNIFVVVSEAIGAFLFRPSPLFPSGLGQISVSWAETHELAVQVPTATCCSAPDPSSASVRRVLWAVYSDRISPFSSMMTTTTTTTTTGCQQKKRRKMKNLGIHRLPTPYMGNHVP